MANQDRRSLFGKLSRLFKTAPIIKSKIKAASSYVELPASSFLQHSRSSSHMYANAIASYGTYDRLCINMTTLIPIITTELPRMKSLSELVKLYPNGEKFTVYAYDPKQKKIVTAEAHHPRSSGFKDTVKTIFTDGSFIVSTPDHKHMLAVGEKVETQRLNSGDILMSVDGTKTIKKIIPWNKIEVGDLTVNGYENFATDTVITSNSRYADFCVTADTLVYTTRGEFTIKELAEKYSNGERFHVWSYDHSDKTIKIGEAHSPRLSFNGQAQNIIRIYFSRDGSFVEQSYIDCTPEHKFLLRDGSECEAKNLKQSDALMPFYVKDLYENYAKAKSRGYKWVYTMDKQVAKGGWVGEHRLIAEYFIRPIEENEQVHHRDFNPSNNLVENLDIINEYEHKRYHTQLNNINKFNKPNRAHAVWMKNNSPNRRQDLSFEKILNVAIECDFNVEKVLNILDTNLNTIKRRLNENGFRNWQDFSKKRDTIQQTITHNNIIKEQQACTLENIKINIKETDTITDLAYRIGCSTNAIRRRLQTENIGTWSDLQKSLDFKTYNNDFTNKRGTKLDSSLTFQNIANSYKDGMTYKELATACNSTFNKVLTRIKNEGYKSYKDFCDVYQNHKVSKVEYLQEKQQVYNLTVDKYHNFAAGKKYVNNDGKTVQAYNIITQSEMEYCVSEHTLIPQPGSRSATIGELAELCSKNPEYTFPVYAYDYKLKEIVPALGKQARQTRTLDEAWKVNFDNGKEIIGSPNHRLMLRDGSYCRIDELQVGDSMMPFIREAVIEGAKDTLVYSLNKEKCVFGGYEYESNILERHKEKLKAGWLSEPEDKSGLTLGKLIDISEQAKFNLVRCSRVSSYKMHEIVTCLKKYGFNNYSDFRAMYASRNPRINLTLQNMFNAFERRMTFEQFRKSAGATAIRMNSTLRKLGFKNFNDWQKNFQNCKVISVEKLEEKLDLYDLTVDGYKNFATDSGVISHNTPEIASAMDIMADEVCASDERGKSLHVYSDNQKIRELLESLFFDTLNVEFTLRGWVRNLPVKYNTLIPLLTGETITIEELSNRIKDGSTEWVYSIQDGTQQVVPGKVTWCDKNYTATKIARVCLDDKTYVETALEHPFILRDGTSKRADELCVGDSLLPFYRKLSKNTDKDTRYELSGYEKIYNPATNSYDYTHRVVARECDIEKDCAKGVIHHKNFKKLDNSPSNLRMMSFIEHGKLHNENCKKILHTPEVTAKRMAGLDRWLRSDEHRELAKIQIDLQEQGFMHKSWSEYNNSELHKEHNVIRSEAGKAFWNDATKRAQHQQKLHIKFDDVCLSFVYNYIKKLDCFINKLKMSVLLRQDEQFVKYFIELNSSSGRDNKKSINSTTLQGLIQRLGFDDYEDAIIKEFPNLIDDKEYKKAIRHKVNRKNIWKSKREQQKQQNTQLINHKVTSIEIIEEDCDVYCMTVVGPNSEEDRHNFMTLSRNISDDSCASSGVCLQNCKYGDGFFFIDVHTQYGVINVFPIPVNEIEREEGYDPENPMAVRFRWATQGNQILENWMVAHFRLNGNDNFLPYGSSVIEPARRIWRQLILIEDAMLVYRIIRSPERRVFYIDVANIESKDVPTFLEKVKTGLKRQSVVNSSSGRVDLRYNPLCHFGGDFLSFCDNTVARIEIIAKDWDKYKDNSYVWSLDKNDNIVPTKLLWVGKTKEKTKFIEVTLDDGQIIRTTHEHRWMLRDGSYKKASDLKPDDRLMPFYMRKNIGKSKHYSTIENYYTDVLNPNDNKWKATHRVVANWKYNNKLSSDKVVHHINHIKHNNHPDNLVELTHEEHGQIHRDIMTAYNKSDVGREKSRVTFIKTQEKHNFHEIWKNLWQDENIRKKRVDKLTLKIDTTLIHFVCLAISELSTSAREYEIRDWLNNNNEFKTYLKSLNNDFKNGFSDKIAKGQFLQLLRRINFNNLRDVKDFYVSIRAPFDKIREFCTSNSIKSENDIIKHFSISKYDFRRILLKNNYTTEKFDNEFLNGGYYNRNTQLLHCRQCTTSYEIRIGYNKDFCDKQCYWDWRKGKTREELGRNHKVISIRESDFECEAYGITVEHPTHLIAIVGNRDDYIPGNGIMTDCLIPCNSADSENTGNLSGVYMKQSVDEDYFIPIRGDSGTKIETLSGGQFTGDIEDVEYIQRKLFAALKIPKAYLSYDEALCTSYHTLIKLIDGRIMPIGELAKLFEDEPRPQHGYAEINRPKNEVWVYTKDKDGQTTPGQVGWCGKTKEVDSIVRITLDSGHVIECTHNHPFMLRDGSYKQATNLKVDDSLMPEYFKLSSKKERDFADGYEKVFNHKTNKWEYTHKIVSNSCDIEIHESAGHELFDIIHHKDCNKLNNDPTNLMRMGNTAHFNYHAKVAQNLLTEESRNKLKIIRETEGYKKALREGTQRAWDEDDGTRRALLADTNRRYKKMQNMQAILLEKKRSGEIDMTGKNCPTWVQRPKIEDVIKIIRSGEKSRNIIRDILQVSLGGIDEIVMNAGFKSWWHFVETYHPTYKRRTVKINNTKYKQLDMNELANTAARCMTQKEFFKVTKLSSSAFYSYCKRNNLNVRVWFNENINKNNHKVLSVEEIQLKEPIAMYDLMVMNKNHNFAIVNHDENTGNISGVIISNSGKSVLAQEDIRFSRTITQIQKTVISELNKIAMIHLASHGFEGADLVNFRLALSNPSTAAQQQKLELWRSRFEIATTVKDTGLLSSRWIQKNIFLLDDQEIETIKEEKLEEKKEEAEIEATASQVAQDIGIGTPGGGGGALPAPGAPPVAGGAPEDLKGIMGGEHPPGEKKEPGELLKTGVEHEWDIIAPSVHKPELLDEIENNANELVAAVKRDYNAERPKGRVRRGKPHKSLAWGSDASEIPDVNVSADFNQPQENDVFDQKYARQVAKMSSKIDEKKRMIDPGVDTYLDKKISTVARMDSELKSTLESFKSALTVAKKNNPTMSVKQILLAEINKNIDDKQAKNENDSSDVDVDEIDESEK